MKITEVKPEIVEPNVALELDREELRIIVAVLAKSNEVGSYNIYSELFDFLKGENK